MIDVGSERQLLMDRHLIEREQGIALKLHCPTLRETVWRIEKPWEGIVSWFPNVMKDEGRYRMWYRAEQGDGEFGRTWDYTAYMESSDGICWERPNLGLIEFEGSKENNLLWPLPGTVGRCVCAFKDGNPAAPPEERYKAIAQGTGGIKGIVCMVSADGIHWRNLEPLRGFSLAECEEVYGDEIERKVTWRECHDVCALVGRPVRLRFALSDADLYAFRFKPEGPEGSAVVN